MIITIPTDQVRSRHRNAAILAGVTFCAFTAAGFALAMMWGSSLFLFIALAIFFIFFFCNGFGLIRSGTENSAAISTIEQNAENLIFTEINGIIRAYPRENSVLRPDIKYAEDLFPSCYIAIDSGGVEQAAFFIGYSTEQLYKTLEKLSVRPANAPSGQPEKQGISLVYTLPVETRYELIGGTAFSYILFVFFFINLVFSPDIFFIFGTLVAVFLSIFFTCLTVSRWGGQIRKCEIYTTFLRVEQFDGEIKDYSYKDYTFESERTYLKHTSVYSTVIYRSGEKQRSVFISCDEHINDDFFNTLLGAHTAHLRSSSE